jgi:hypothetical protein
MLIIINDHLIVIVLSLVIVFVINNYLIITVRFHLFNLMTYITNWYLIQFHPLVNLSPKINGYNLIAPCSMFHANN